MNRALVDRIANAVLYEGYILYPYRPSLRNRQRWNFGGLYPEPYFQSLGEAASNQTQCLVSGTAATRIEVIIRFLHLTARTVGEVASPIPQWPKDDEIPFRPVPTLHIGEQLLHTWQEAEEREIALDDMRLGDLAAQPRHVPLSFPGGRRSEPVRDADGMVGGVLRREQQAIQGEIAVEAAEAAEGLFRLTCRVQNCTSPTTGQPPNRDEALLHSLVSAHTILGVQDGAFVSLLDPPEGWRPYAADCRNIGVWPVLVGKEGHTDTMLSSRIILYDYPQLAPESPGDFFDNTEIDELLTLRILTLTDEEKRSMATVDERARRLLERTESMTDEQLRGLHGAIRDFHLLMREEGNG
jgi:hypothetical protein